MKLLFITILLAHPARVCLRPPLSSRRPPSALALGPREPRPPRARAARPHDFLNAGAEGTQPIAAYRSLPLPTDQHPILPIASGG